MFCFVLFYLCYETRTSEASVFFFFVMRPARAKRVFFFSARAKRVLFFFLCVCYETRTSEASVFFFFFSARAKRVLFFFLSS